MLSISLWVIYTSSLCHCGSPFRLHLSHQQILRFRHRNEWPLSGLRLQHSDRLSKVGNGPSARVGCQLFVQHAATDLMAVTSPRRSSKFVLRVLAASKLRHQRNLACCRAAREPVIGATRSTTHASNSMVAGLCHGCLLLWLCLFTVRGDRHAEPSRLRGHRHRVDFAGQHLAAVTGRRRQNRGPR